MLLSAILEIKKTVIHGFKSTVILFIKMQVQQHTVAAVYRQSDYGLRTHELSTGFYFCMYGKTKNCVQDFEIVD